MKKPLGERRGGLNSALGRAYPLFPNRRFVDLQGKGKVPPASVIGTESGGLLIEREKAGSLPNHYSKVAEKLYL